jgi:hypothetical protein
MALAFPLAIFGNLLRMLFIIMAAELGWQLSGLKNIRSNEAGTILSSREFGRVLI